MAERHHVVVDGSNLATEGRTLPSLAQLDAAVRAYLVEDPEAEIVVVVDASFEHRIDASERDQLEQAELHGEVVSPPAGAIGRGDAFVLRIAERTNAVVLSNDSFQEFHGEHPWLFDPGRLVGGKPVPGVGWIFTPRVPVRGAKSREATTRANRDARSAAVPAPVKAAEVAKAAKKVAKAAKAAKAAKKPARHPDGSVPRIGDVWGAQPVPPEHAAGGEPAAPGAGRPSGEVEAKPARAAAAPAKRAAKKAVAAEPAPAGEVPAEVTAEAPEQVAQGAGAPAEKSTKKAAKAAKKAAKTTAKVAKVAKTAKKATKKAADGAKKAPAAKAAKKAPGAKKAPKKEAPATVRAVAAPATKAAKKAAKRAPEQAVTASAVAGAGVPVAAAEPDAARGARRRASVADSRVRAAIAEAMAEAFDPSLVDGRAGSTRGRDEPKSGKSGKRRRVASSPPPAVNEPLAFIMFVAAYPIGSTVEGVVASYTSHGAMVEVALPDEGSLHCYIPLTNLGDPPPTKAREVLARGERRHFVLVGLDPARRVAELALEPAAAAGATG